MRLLKILILINSMLIAFVVGCGFTYFLSISNRFPLTETTFSGVISGILSFLGGLVGGLVAFGVSRSQFIQDRTKEKNKQNIVYKNILRALLNELKHNKTILSLIDQTDVDKKALYIESLEDDVWRTIKFDASNFLDGETYNLLDVQNREYSDLKKGLLPDYQDIKKVDFKTRVEALDKIIKIIEEKYKTISLEEKGPLI